MCSIKISSELKQNIGTTECFRMTGQGFTQGKHNRVDPHKWGTCVLVPWAQLQSLMVCTGESLQWLPPHGPLNTSGHMVCLVGRERVSRMAPDGTAVSKICLASFSWSICTIASSQLCISPWYMSWYIRLCSLNRWQWDIYTPHWK